MIVKPLTLSSVLVGCAAAVAVAFAPAAAADPNQCQSGGTGPNSAGPPTCETSGPAVTATPPEQGGPNTGNGPYGPWGNTPPIG